MIKYQVTNEASVPKVNYTEGFLIFRILQRFDVPKVQCSELSPNIRSFAVIIWVINLKLQSVKKTFETPYHDFLDKTTLGIAMLWNCVRLQSSVRDGSRRQFNQKDRSRNPYTRRGQYHLTHNLDDLLTWRKQNGNTKSSAANVLGYKQ